MGVTQAEVESESGVIGHVEDDLFALGKDVKTIGHGCYSDL